MPMPHWQLIEPISTPAWRPWENHPPASSLLYGYSVYTTFLWPISPQGFHPHWQRLKQNAETLNLSVSLEAASLFNLLQAHLSHSQEIRKIQNPVVRLTVLPQIEYYDTFFSKTPLSCALILSLRPGPQHLGTPTRLCTIHHQRALPTLKTGSMAELIHLKRQVVSSKQADDILLVNTKGQLCETSSSNIFLVKDTTLYTPDPERDGCLPGVTRMQVLEIASQEGLDIVTNASIPMDAVPQYDAAFLTNAVQGIRPVSQIDAHGFKIHHPMTEHLSAILKTMQAL